MASARLQGNAGPQAGPVSDSERSAWREFSKYLKQQRARSYKKAVRKIHQLDIENLCSQLKRELQSGRDERLHLDPEFPSRIAAAVRDSWGLVQKAGQKALVSHAVKATHAFRIAAKNLRYRLEAMQESRLLNVSESLHELKRLQQSLGSWHDREVLQEALQAMLVNTNLLRGSWSKTRHVVALAISLDAEKAILAEDCYKVSAKVLATIEKLDPGSRDQ
jgi:CHAD domain-containing protein